MGNIAVQNEMVPNVWIENQFLTVPNNVHEFDAWLNNFDAPFPQIGDQFLDILQDYLDIPSSSVVNMAGHNVAAQPVISCK